MTISCSAGNGRLLAENDNRNPRTLQSHGCVIALNRDWVVVSVSETVKYVLGIPAQSMIDVSIENVFPNGVVHQIRSRAQIFAYSDTATRVFSIELFEDGKHYDMTLHSTADHYVIEIERKHASQQMRDDIALVRHMTAALKSEATLTGLMQSAASSLKILTGCHLGGVYRIIGDAPVVVQATAPVDGGFLARMIEDGSLQQVASRLHAASGPYTRSVANWDDHGTELVPRGSTVDLSKANLAKWPRPFSPSTRIGAGSVTRVTVNNEIWGGLFGISASAHAISPAISSAVELFSDFLSAEIARVSLAEPPSIAGTPIKDVAELVSDVSQHVLVVEDDLSVALDMAQAITKMGAGKVEIAGNQAQALKYLETHRPDFVLLDLRLETGTSIEVANHLKDRGIPFALATGYSNDDINLAEIGNPVVLRKPVANAALQEALGKASAA